MLQDDNGFKIPDPPKLPKDGKEFFNILMEQIEPELTLDNAPHLKEKYAEETPEEHIVRMERYKKGLNLYREKRDHYFATFKQEVARYNKTLNKEAEAMVSTLEQSHLEALEAHFV